MLLLGIMIGIGVIYVGNRGNGKEWDGWWPGG